jgi:uncharacterized membrane protein
LTGFPLANTLTEAHNAVKRITLFSGYKKWFFKGLAALLPTLVTLVILMYLVSFINDNFGRCISEGIVKGAGWMWPDLQAPSHEEVDNHLKSRGINTKTMDRETSRRLFIQTAQDIRNRRLEELGRSWIMVLLGFVLALVLVTILGLFLASFIGRTFWRYAEEVFTRIPVVKQIYPYVKQVTDYIFGQKKFDFSQVVAVRYPSREIWQIGFITGAAIRAFQEGKPEGKEFVTVFIPTSPTPFTGFVAVVPREDVLNLPMTIDQALRFLISGGVISPEVSMNSADMDK